MAIPQNVLTPEYSLSKDAMRRKMAYALLMRGTSGEPVQAWTQGLARMAEGAMGGYELYRDDQDDKAKEGRIAAALSGLPGLGGGEPPMPMEAPQAPPQPQAAPVQPKNPIVAALGPRPGVMSDAPPVSAPRNIPVQSSPAVVGDQEGIDRGLYPPTAFGDRFSGVNPQGQPGAMQPRPVQTQPVAPQMTQAPMAPARAVPTIPPAEAESIRNLMKDPATRAIGMQRYQQFMTPKEQSRPMTAEERASYKVPDNVPASIDMTTNKPAYGPSPTNVTTNVGGGSDKQIFDTMDTRANEARTIASGLTGLREARAAVQSGAITGAGANQVLGLQKVGSALGLSNSDKIVNTETFRAAIAPQVAAVLKSTVGTANISNTDREFAEKAAGGNITLDEKSIIRLLDIMEKASIGKLTTHQKTLERVYPDGEKHARERALFGVDMPAEIPAPQSAAPKVRKYNPDTGKIE